MSDVIVLKLGGSAVSTSKDTLIDFEYLNKLKELILSYPNKKFFIILGGGYTMRMYRDISIANGITDKTELHWIGTTVNVLHAYISKAFMADIAEQKVYKYEDYYDEEKVIFNKQVIFGGGGRPGQSGDVCAILASQKVGSQKIISLKNVDYIYDKDPSKFKDVNKQTKLSWDEYLKIIDYKDVHEPGGNYPIDPVACRMAKQLNLDFYIVKCSNISSIAQAIEGNNFEGSLVTNN